MKTTQRSFIEATDGTRLAYQDWGTGRPILLLTPANTTASIWQYTVTDFVARGFRCVSFDRRGHGRSDLPPGGYDMPQLADDVASVVDALDLRDVVLAGWSLGGTEAVAYLARHGSSRVSRLVLLAAVLPALLKTASNPEGVDASVVEALRAQWTEDYPKWCEDGVDAFFNIGAFPAHRRMIDWMVEMIVSTPLPVALRCNEAMAKEDLRDAMRKLDVPTLVLHGALDASIPVEFGRRTAQLPPQARYVELPDAAHGLVFTHRERILRETCDWLGAA